MRNGYRRPRVDRMAGGLFEALRAERQGDSALLHEWMGAGYPALRGSLEAHGLDPALADETASEVVARARGAQRAGAAVEDDCAWMSGVAAHVRSDVARLRRRTRPLSLSLGFP